MLRRILNAAVAEFHDELLNELVASYLDPVILAPIYH